MNPEVEPDLAALIPSRGANGKYTLSSNDPKLIVHDMLCLTDIYGST